MTSLTRLGSQKYRHSMISKLVQVSSSQGHVVSLEFGQVGAQLTGGLQHSVLFGRAGIGNLRSQSTGSQRRSD